MTPNEMPNHLPDASKMVAEMREMRAKATSGTWHVCGPPWGNNTYVFTGPTEDPHLSRGLIADGSFCNEDGDSEVDVEGNMEFICYAANNFPAIADKMERLQAAVDGYATAFDDQHAEIERLTKENAHLRKGIDDTMRHLQITGGASEVLPCTAYVILKRTKEQADGE